jgi:two-component system, sensor histidine kinase and response regulator
MSQAHILIVDDDAALLQALPQALHLRLPEVIVDTVDSAPAALERILEIDYDAIVSDIKMPGMDGLALLARIRELWPDTPTLLITGHGEHDLAIQALRGGAYDFIQKPIEREYFVASLQRAIQARQLRRQVEAQQQALADYAADLEAKVAERTQELQTVLAAKEEFMSIAAHELKTPLTTLKALVQITQKRLTREQRPEAELATRMESALKRMELLVSDLLDGARIEAGKLYLRREQMDLAALCQEVIDEYTDELQQNVQFVAPPQPVWYDGDRDRLHQVLTNLISNAVKYSSEQTPITVGLDDAPGGVRLWVQDHGIGIPAEALPHIFDRFYRVPQVEVQTGSRVGVGLGLYIAHEIVERHGGSLDVASTINQGSTFTVVLPVPTKANAARRTRGHRSEEQ